MRAFLPADLGRLHAVDVDFGHWLQLGGLRVDPGPASLHLHLRWRCLRRCYRPWRCFVHVFDGEQRVSSLDHALLGSRPEVRRWEPGDEGFEKLDHWFDRRPGTVTLRLGVYDPEVNVRCPILASTLPVIDASSAVVIDPAGTPGSDYLVRFHTPPLTPCGVLFQDDLELTAYSTARHGDLAWLRLKWTLRGAPRRRLRFFGHAVAEPTATASALAQFDQELALDRRGPATTLEQNILTRLAAPEARWLRAGVCTEPDLIRLPILAGPDPYDPAERCFYRPIQCSNP